jgi:hypothetical protein
VESISACLSRFRWRASNSRRLGKDNLVAAVRSYGELNKGLQTISAKLVDYSKTWFEQPIKALEQLVGAKSLEQALEIQSQYAKKAYDLHVVRFPHAAASEHGLPTKYAIDLKSGDLHPGSFTR